MTYSNAYETYSTSEITTPEGNNMSARKPVEGTIPYNYIPNDPKIKTNPALLMSYMAKNHYTHDPAKMDEERVRAASEIQDPLERWEFHTVRPELAREAGSCAQRERNSHRMFARS